MTHAMIQGADAAHMVRDITFENITHNNGIKVCKKILIQKYHLRKTSTIQIEVSLILI